VQVLRLNKEEAFMQQQELTERQQSILRFIARHINKHGYQPSLRELGAEFGIKNPNGVLCHLRSMERKGHVSLLGSTARAVQFKWKEYL